MSTEAEQSQDRTPEETTDPQAAALSLLQRMFFPAGNKQPLFYHALRRDVVITRTSQTHSGEWAIMHRATAVAGGIFWRIETARGVEDLLAPDVARFVDAVLAWSV